jgi:hypothetical protein
VRVPNKTFTDYCTSKIQKIKNSVFIFEQLFETKNGGVPGYFQLPTVTPNVPTQDKATQLNSTRLKI